MNDVAPLGASGADAADEPPRSRSPLVSLAALAVVVYTADLLTKTLAVRHLDPSSPVEIVGDVVTLSLVRNSGAAFSMATGYTWILTIIALAVVVAIIRFSSRLRSLCWAVGLGLVLGGALGNLTDRFFREPGPLRGHVVDFISVGWWPVFNVADSAVVCGAILLVALTLLGFDYDGTRSGWAARNDEDPAVADGEAGTTAPEEDRDA
ncbi:MAG: signal peptidase II [Gordonia sp. (in: high G+C Gram-positive bacteria)]|uniref:signal peptidase II n=1 Tax=Gordonia sp. (in: high G+C Gram-positive bacteria) TaxID=84139 RepID=UPI0039E317B5